MTHSGETFDRSHWGDGAGEGPWAYDDSPVVYKGLSPPRSRPIVFLDTEYTGFPVIAKPGSGHGNAQPVDVHAFKLTATGLVEEYGSKVAIHDSHRRSRNPGWEKVVGYDPKEWAREARPVNEVARELFEFVQGCAWVSHGYSDLQLWSFVWSCFGIRFGPLTCFPTICTEVLCRQLVPGLRSYTVDSLCEHFGIPPEQEHRARGGAERCQKIFQKLAA